jgi:hypothetical protein
LYKRTNHPTKAVIFFDTLIILAVQQKIPAKLFLTRKLRFHLEGSLIIIHHKANKKEFLS